jgi:putative membrane protein
MKNLKVMFTQKDRNLIEEAVRAAELRTGGEIVPYAVIRSDHYEEAEWRAGFVVGLLSLIGLYAGQSLSLSWTPPGMLEVCAATLGGFVFGLLCVRFLPPLKRFMAGKHVIARRVEQRAAEAFMSEEVFQTRDRSGVLIFVSMLERKVLVIGDAGINAKVAKDDWHDIVRRVIEGIKKGSPAEGLIDAIQQCGILLEKHGVSRRPDDRNELTDSLRTDDRE